VTGSGNKTLAKKKAASDVCWPVIIIIITVIILRPQAHITVHSYYHCIHPAATGQSLHAQLAIMRMMLIVVIITIVRSHLGSSVKPRAVAKDDGHRPEG
jgi:hypothetical protein